MASDPMQSSRFAVLRDHKLAEVESRLAQLEAKLEGLRADKKPLVFLGLSLSEEKAEALIDADFRPPIRRGDLDSAVAGGYRWIGVIDGVFHQENTVSLREIQTAIKCGARLYGSSSMGALRAVEARPLGMIGVGRIYEWYRDEVIDSDDEVAISFDEVRKSPLSEPLVNIRATLNLAEEKGVLDAQTKSAALTVAEGMRYPDRNYRGIVAALASSIRNDQLVALEKFLTENTVDLKALDAVELLNRMRHDYELRRKSKPIRD